MSNSRFEDFLNKQNSQSQSTMVDWNIELNEWKESLESLYKEIQSFLQPYIQEEKINLSYQIIKIEEENIGEYEVQEALISFGNNAVKLVPIGTNLIGAKGRVDLIGPKGKIRFVLVNSAATAPKISFRVCIQGEEHPEEEECPEEIKWEWKIATSPPQVRYFPLTKDSFFDSLMEISNE